MEPISGMISGTKYLPSTVAGVKAPPKAQRPEDEAQNRPTSPMRDEYIPEEKRKPSDRCCTCNTDNVDREIEKLKKEKEELARQINSETDETKIKELEKKLAQIESELSKKDNDTYRRQHAAFS